MPKFTQKLSNVFNAVDNKIATALLTATGRQVSKSADSAMLGTGLIGFGGGDILARLATEPASPAGTAIALVLAFSGGIGGALTARHYNKKLNAQIETTAARKLTLS